MKQRRARMNRRILTQALVALALLVFGGIAARADDDRALNYVSQSVDKFVNQDYDGAIADCNQAIEIDPSYETAYTNRAMSEYMKKDYDASIADDTKALELNPQE